jgi:DNA-binding transcriptional MerR regulator
MKYLLCFSMQRLPKQEKELIKKIARLEKSLQKAFNDSVREKIWESIEKLMKELAELTKGNGTTF